MTLRIHSLHHVPFEGLGSIAAWAQAAGHQISSTRLYAGESPPPLGQVDWLIVMGGPMGINDTERHPWLRKEKIFIGQAIDQGKKVLGICLGAQLIADVLGASVHPNPEKEIGWFPVFRTPEAMRLPIADQLPDHQEVFHWHGDTFELPAGAVHLLRSDQCKHQAFLYENRVLALQFHLETTPESAADLLRHCAAELVGAPYIQTPAAIMAKPERFATINRQMTGILDYFSK
jgi:GMP synthase (glutamine-hydrolysing)